MTRALFTVSDVLERKGADGVPIAQIVRMNPSFVNNPDHPNYALQCNPPFDKGII